jgi:hypothetical protein
MHNAYPHGSDFQKIADCLYEKEEESQIEGEAELAILLKKDPRLQQEILR